VDVPTSELEQESWGVKVPFNLSQIDAFTWEVKDKLSAKTGSLAIKDFVCMGGTLPFPAEKPESKCDAGGGTSSSSVRSSSSRGSSSSAGSSSSGRSSSSNSASSSSSGDDTPVLLPQLVYSNALIPMQNAVNLQVTGNAAVQIFDLKGNAVRTLNFARGNYVVQIADLPKGLYLVKASSSSWKQTIAVPVR